MSTVANFARFVLAILLGGARRLRAPQSGRGEAGRKPRRPQEYRLVLLE